MKAKGKHFLPLAAIILPTLLTACGGDSAQTFQRTSSGLGTTSGSNGVVAASPTSTAAMAYDAYVNMPMRSNLIQAEPTISEYQYAPSGGEAAKEPPYLAPEEILPPNPFVATSEDRLSTFAMDIDTASYSAVRNYLNTNTLPPAQIVRVEEFVNYFHYNYPAPQEGAFGISIDSAPSPYGQSNSQIVRVGIQGKTVEAKDRKPAVLTFVIDVSGSMQEPNRLPLVKQALRLLVNELNQEDQIGIVVYGSQARVLLDHTNASNKDQILSAIDSLQEEGSTNAEAGLRLAYKLAGDHFVTGSINRLILCSDGVANVGETGPDGIRTRIRDYTAQGIELSTIGFGMGDYNDYLMEQLADDGNGNYAYVDDLDEAKRIFVQNLTGMLQTIAKDAKIQVDFNPDVVAQYRLIGYENRAVADTDFRNDKVDAGEVGAGHSVTALYEVELTKDAPSAPALTVQVRYADPDNGQVHEISQQFGRNQFGASVNESVPQLQLAVAVAGFAEQLRSTTTQYEYAGVVLSLAQQAANALPNDPDAQEFALLVAKATDLK